MQKATIVFITKMMRIIYVFNVIFVTQNSVHSIQFFPYNNNLIFVLLLYLLTAKWAANAILSGLKAHTLRLCTLTTPSMLIKVSSTSTKFTPFGMPSINTIIVSRSMLNVVTNTNMEKKNVHIGSTIFQSGCKN